MKTTMLITVFTVAVALTGSMAFGQHLLVANIPFDFQIPAAHLPPGNYEILAGQGAGGNVASLRHVESRKSYFMILNRSLSETSSALEKPPRLVFRCVDGACSLSEMWPGYRESGWSIPVREKRSSKTDHAASQATILAAQR